MEAVGLRDLASKHVLSSFERSGIVAQRVVARISTNRFAQVNSTKGTWSLLQDINLASGPQPAAITRAQAAPIPAPSAAAQQAQLGREEISAMVRAIATEILGDNQLDSNGQFPPGGFDSLSAVEFSNKIGQAAGVDLASTLVFDYPSVPAIAGFLMEKLTPASAPQGKPHCAACSVVPPSGVSMTRACASLLQQWTASRLCLPARLLSLATPSLPSV